MAGNVTSLTPSKQTNPEKIRVLASTSTGNQGRVRNETISWPKLRERLGTAILDNVTLPEYLAKPVAWQDKRKNQGYFVGGQFEHGARKLENLRERTLLTFDVDNCTPELLAKLMSNAGWLHKYEYFIYSTRKHTPEKPRIRIVMPPSCPIPVARFGPMSRIVASKIDKTMQAVDPVSFRASQIMYWPSTCKDAEFIAYHNPGKPIDCDAVLALHPDWTNYTTLPRSPRERSLRASSDKTTDPRTKRGWVGAYCRVYSIEGAIDKYLSDVYEPGTDAGGLTRYSYIGGSTTNGAVVYDEGMQLYSWHGTDPCSDRLVNPFDMHRIHRFGHLDPPTDMDAGDGDDPTALPSYKAMVAVCRADDAVVREMSESLYDRDNIDADSIFEEEGDDVVPALPGAIAVEVTSAAVAASVAVADKPQSQKLDKSQKVESPAPAVVPDWMDRLDRTEAGIVKSTLYNVQLIVQHDKRFKGAFAYNEFVDEAVQVRRIRSREFEQDTGPIRDPENGNMISEGALGAIRCVLEGPRGENKSGWGLRVSDRDIRDTIAIVSHRSLFHPIRRYLSACRWDGVPRIAGLWVDYFHAEDTPYHRATARLMMVAAVARVFEPGHKFDFVTVLEGVQGIGKSSALSILAGPGRFAEFSADVTRIDKVIENLQGKWIVEIPELVQFGKAETEQLKALFSGTSDRARLAWARSAKDYDRQNVFVGTTNQTEWLRDLTGNRRYWPVKLPNQSVNTAALERDRDQLWAEAYQDYLWMRRQFPNKPTPLPLFLAGIEADTARGLQATRMVSGGDDMFQGQIHEWLETPVAQSQAGCGWRPDAAAAMEENAGEPFVLRDTVCIRDVIRFCLGMDEYKQDRNTAVLVGRALAAAPGWVKGGSQRLGAPLGKTKVWIRDDNDTEL